MAEGRNAKRAARWEDLTPELLAVICGRMMADEIARSVPFVCRAWRDAVMSPYCWADVDVEQWCRRVNRSDVIDAAIRRLVRRGGGCLRRLCAYRLGNSGFASLSNCGRCLRVLNMPVSEVADQIVEKHASLFIALTELDISYCVGITPKGLEAIGKHCRCLLNLRRNMPPPETEFGPQQNDAPRANDEEALAVASTMSGLRRLELAYGQFGDRGLDAITSQCKLLQVLDILGCWCVEMAGDLEDRCYAIPGFRGPWDDDYDDIPSGEDEHGSNVDVGSSDDSE